MLEPTPGDVYRISGLSPNADPINIVLEVGGSIILDRGQRIPWLVIASTGMINRVGIFEESTMLFEHAI